MDKKYLGNVWNIEKKKENNRSILLYLDFF